MKASARRANGRTQTTRKDWFPTAIATLHPHLVPSISAKADAQAFRALALDLESDPLSTPPELYMTRDARIAAF
jgi:hypothetical protein